MRVSLVQLSVSDAESADDRRARAAALVRGRAGDDLVVLPELWTTGAWAYDDWQTGAEPISTDGPTLRAMSAAARSAAVWLHAGTVVERDGDGALYTPRWSSTGRGRCAVRTARSTAMASTPARPPGWPPGGMW